MTVLLTGASGFVGQAALQALQLRGVAVRPVFRSAGQARGVAGTAVVSGLDADTVWSAALQDVDVVVHAAARAHIMRDEALDPLAEYRRVNVQGTLHLARQAAAAGVRRFVFISSIKVNGEGTQPGRAFTADDAPAPEDAYGLSKAEAEAGLRELCRAAGMELTIIRPVLVYGPGVKGNLASMLRWVRRALPLPLGAVTDNRRSLVALDNLVDFMLVCMEHPQAANQVFLVSDGEDVSTAQLLRNMAAALQCPSRLLPVPVGLLRLGARLLGKQAVAQRLLGSLQVDITKNRKLLGWTPPVTMQAALQKMKKADA
ncbi:MAG: SDR family oxidoreductase [Proteobacteria bacterium]|nr:SDR family oxidoreductase [Pseudomonadota bacterium]